MYSVGARVLHITSNSYGTVTRVAEYGDVWILLDGAKLPLTTRGVFLIPA